MPEVGEVFRQKILLSSAEIAAFSSLVQDFNPVHHRLEAALTQGFSDTIASGTQTSGLTMGVTASYFSRESSMLGLEFTMKFRRPVLANLEHLIEWHVVEVTWKTTLNGFLVKLEGELRSSTDVCITSSATVLVGA